MLYYYTIKYKQIMLIMFQIKSHDSLIPSTSTNMCWHMQVIQVTKTFLQSRMMYNVNLKIYLLKYNKRTKKEEVEGEK